MRNASLVYFLPDLDDGSGQRFLNRGGRDRLDHILYPYMHTNAVTTVRTYNAQSRFAKGLDEYANDIYCKTIVAVGKALYGENLRQVLKNLRVPVDHPQSALPENAHADYARLNHRLHLIAVPDWQSALALGDTLDSYFDLLAGDSLVALSRQIGALLRKRSWSIATAESCTGGAIVKTLTDVSGSSDYVRGGACTYTAETKERVLGGSDRRPRHCLRRNGAGHGAGRAKALRQRHCPGHDRRRRPWSRRRRQSRRARLCRPGCGRILRRL